MRNIEAAKEKYYSGDLNASTKQNCGGGSNNYKRGVNNKSRTSALN